MVLKFCQHVYISMQQNDILTTLCPFFLIFYAFFSTTVTRSDKSLSSQSAIFFVDWVGGVLLCYNANIWVLLSLRRGGGEGDKLCYFSSRGGTQAMGWFTYIEPLRQSLENDLFQKKWQVGIADANSIKKGGRNERYTYYIPFYVLVQQCSFWL